MFFWRWILTGLVGLAVFLTPHSVSARQGDIPPIPNLRFEHLTVDQGLSNSEIMAILQDRSGYLWFGTQNGLNRYDGYTVTNFLHNSDDPRSISSSVVLAAAESADGTLWFGTDSGGLNRYDPATGHFTAYLNNPSNPNSLANNAVWSLLVDRHGYVWAGTRGGLSRLDPRTGLFTHYEPNPGDDRPLSKWVLSIYEDSHGALWVGTRMGLNRLDRAAGHFTVYRPDESKPGAISHEQAWAIYEDSRGTLWVGTRGGGLNRYDPATDSFTAYMHDPDDPRSLSHNTVWAIIEDPSGDLWIGTEGGGLNRLNPQTMRFTAYRANPDDPYALTSDDIFRLVLDRSGVLWIGSRVGGVNKLYPALQRFTHYRHLHGSPQSLSVNFASGLLVGSDGVLWAGTRGGGLNRIDPSTGQVTAYRADPEDPGSLSHDYIYNIHEDEAGMLWLTTQGGGLNRFDPRSGHFTRWQSDPNNPAGLITNYVNVILPAGDGQFWLGTLGFGLEKFDPATGTAAHYRYDPADPHSLSEDTVNDIVPDGQGGLWVGTFRGGLNYFDPATGRFTRYQHDPRSPTSLSDNNVQSLFIDHAGALWVGTMNGLNRFDPRFGNFAHYTTRDGLPSDSIYCIQEDHLNQLWLGTGKGLTRFDPAKGNFRTYGPEDGVQSNQFTQYSCGKGADGRLYFGGPNGLNAFRPEALTESSYTPPVALTGLLLFNKPLSPGEPASALPGPIDRLDELRLNHDQNVITFEFAALNYQNTARNLYQYRMVGFDKDWSPPGSRRQATYTNLAPGEYIFQVRASNHDGVWIDEPRSLRVIIQPPWWQTSTFMAAVTGLALALLVGGVQARLRSVHAQNQALEQRVRERTQALIAANGQLTEEIRRRAEVEDDLRQAKEAAEAANQAKTAFLATMSHELRTPLHVILGYTDLIARQPALPETEREQLSAIGRSGEHLLTLINDVLDLSKIEAGRMELNANPFDLRHMLRDLEEMFRLPAGQKGLALRFEPAPSLPRLVRADEVRLRQMLINLIGNAVKFTEEGSITVRAWADEQPAQAAVGPAPDAWPVLSDDPTNAWATFTAPAAAEPAPPPPNGEGDLPLRLAFQIADTGPGIAADELPRLFQNFSQARAGRSSRQGTGLGLALVARFASLMGGQVTVQSQLGRGSTFTFTIQAALPFTTLKEGDPHAAFAAEPANGTAAGSAATAPAAPGQPAIRVLVVDDEPDNREMLLTVLRPLGFELREAADGQQALELWQQWQPHLIWLDMRMPVMDGYQTARAIRSRAAGQGDPTVRTRIVALSASAQGEERERILAAGCDAVLLKPVRAQEIYDYLAQLDLRAGPPNPTPPATRPARETRADGAARPSQPVSGSPQPLPPDLAGELIYAAQRTDPKRLLALIERVRLIDSPLAASLTGLVKQYNYEAILNYLASTLPTQPNASWPPSSHKERE